ncbi:L,D-transpeptidase [Candidatus Falkowbacteria bacterium]|uniref:L,D-TPase catalytic domain-containing protein n=1 Tax=Candidatus Falkowbacteria bacterium CG10_big_fil_rev_8_21_14_0_10_37_18 TaxID=1974562 RepID=A0A2H0V815_9BACT|nr:L,D-transpeptidase [Candidatus Falkowbacteria bacterium]NCQ12814.1 L,D-transpeptidase [Candidatus Falkowbacteria bacterium]OIO06385.1 MAG: hypothetical protein AUJ26_00805 [Candidatus Falkowbacteria bacterium CG1_02_37_21]PIR95208.1 MAG: hypothetical protein COT93_03650 [Candidatus Falkowbacteria bacterium CG10_big_fil_rev_8_21_14_0_10_37_18]
MFRSLTFLLFFLFFTPGMFFGYQVQAATLATAPNPISSSEVTIIDPTLDSDGDGYPDVVEIDWGYDPFSTSTKRLTQKIEINLSEQKLIYYVDNKFRHEFSVSTGRPGMATPLGTFQVVNKAKKAWSAAYGLWMPFWMGLGGNGLRNGSIGIHELPVWPNGYREGEDHLGHPVSHGCIRLGLDSARYVYEHAPVGTEVVVK